MREDTTYSLLCHESGLEYVLLVWLFLVLYEEFVLFVEDRKRRNPVALVRDS